MGDPVDVGPPRRTLRARVRSRLSRLVRRVERPPLVSVVVAFRDAGEHLETCVARLLEQTHPAMEIILVDDGSTDRSAADALALAAEHPQVVRLRQDAHGIGRARNLGVSRARGEYLAFCDADDTAPRDAYERLVSALRASGSDLAVASPTLQIKGRHVRPRWARRSNPTRRLGVTLQDHPALLANLVLGCRLFRLSTWRRQGTRFPEDGAFPDLVTVVETLSRAERIDVLPAVTYRWCWRQDGRTLVQRSLQETDLMRERLRRLREAGELVNAVDPALQGSYFIEVLHTTIPDLVRAAVTHEDDQDGYWATLSSELADLLGLMTPETLARVATEDRVLAWLCGRDHRPETEEFLEYAFDNTWGFPFQDASPRPVVRLDFLDELTRDDPEFARVAPVDMRYRTRLTDLSWAAPERLTMRGAAFIEYVDDRRGASRVAVVLRRLSDGEEALRVEASPCPDLGVDLWANRAHEEHRGAGFEVTLDLSALPWRDRREVFEVLVELDLDGEQRSGPFATRRTASSAGLLEPGGQGPRQWVPTWRPFEGLRLVSRAAATALPAGDDPDTAVVTSVDEEDGGADAVATLVGWRSEPGRLHLDVATSVATEVALVGPRAASDWTPVQPGATTTVSVALSEDEWGLGETPLPENNYRVLTRNGGTTRRVRIAEELWRGLPVVLPAGEIELHPSLTPAGAVSFDVVGTGAQVARAPYTRRRLRDQHYPVWRRQPLRDSVLYETFAGKGAGDNPGALCRELLTRDTGLDVAFSVTDFSIPVPDGARKVLRFSEEYFELLGRSRYIVTNAALSYFFRRRDDQVVVQTWHGSPLKRIAHDRPFQDFFNWHHRRQILTARENWDFLLSQSEFCTGALRTAFRYSGEVWEMGYPRNDLLRSEEAAEVRARTRQVLGLADDEHVVLYAPTWRDNVRVGAVFQKVLYLDAEQVVAEIPRSVVLVRGHYNSVRDADVSRPEHRVVDVTRYPDIADLYLAADSLVTDYSSVFFDFVLTDKPMVFLAPDLAEYRDENRGFYLDYHETVPGPVCTTTDEVIAALRGPDEHGPTREKFRATYTPHDDGQASRRINDAMLGL